MSIPGLGGIDLAAMSQYLAQHPEVAAQMKAQVEQAMAAFMASATKQASSRGSSSSQQQQLNDQAAQLRAQGLMTGRTVGHTSSRIDPTTNPMKDLATEAVMTDHMNEAMNGLMTGHTTEQLKVWPTKGPCKWLMADLTTCLIRRGLKNVHTNGLRPNVNANRCVNSCGNKNENGYSKNGLSGNANDFAKNNSECVNNKNKN